MLYPQTQNRAQPQMDLIPQSWGETPGVATLWLLSRQRRRKRRALCQPAKTPAMGRGPGVGTGLEFMVLKAMGVELNTIEEPELPEYQ